MHTRLPLRCTGSVPAAFPFLCTARRSFTEGCEGVTISHRSRSRRDRSRHCCRLRLQRLLTATTIRTQLCAIPTTATARTLSLARTVRVARALTRAAPSGVLRADDCVMCVHHGSLSCLASPPVCWPWRLQVHVASILTASGHCLDSDKSGQ